MTFEFIFEKIGYFLTEFIGPVIEAENADHDFIGLGGIDLLEVLFEVVYLVVDESLHLQIIIPLDLFQQLNILADVVLFFQNFLQSVMILVLNYSPIPFDVKFHQQLCL